MTKELHEQSVAMEATPEECVQKALETWKCMNCTKHNKGFDELIRIILHVYRKEVDKMRVGNGFITI